MTRAERLDQLRDCAVSGLDRVAIERERASAPIATFAPNPDPRGWSADDIADLRDLAARGFSGGQTARVLNRSRSAVLGACYRHSIRLKWTWPAAKSPELNPHSVWLASHGGLSCSRLSNLASQSSGHSPSGTALP